jgi:thiamine-phosphate pyrophosphorylase
VKGRNPLWRGFLLVSAAIGFDERSSSGDTSVPSDASLYLDLEIAVGRPEAATSLLAAVLEAAPIASVLIRPASGAALDAATARNLVAMAQKKGVAALVLDSPSGAAELKADGVHVGWSADIVSRFKDARKAAQPGAIVGADAGRTRHDAMELGEAGADYVAFGIPRHVEDRARAAERQLDLVSWWSELFEIPCVAFDVSDAVQAARLAEAGADFVSVTLGTDVSATDAVARVREFAEALKVREGAR